MPLILQTGINRQGQIREAAEDLHSLGHGQRPKPPGLGLYRLLLSIMPDGVYHICSLTDYGMFAKSKAKPNAFSGAIGFMRYFAVFVLSGIIRSGLHLGLAVFYWLSSLVLFVFLATRKVCRPP